MALSHAEHRNGNSVAAFEAERFYKRAQQLYLLDGNDEQALAVIDSALRIDPGKSKALVLKAEILFSSGSYRQALAVIQSAIETRPNWSEPYLSLANILSVIGNYTHALEACNQGIQRLSDQSSYLLPSLLEQKLSLLLRLRRFKEVQKTLRFAAHQLNEAEYTALEATFNQLRKQHRPKALSGAGPLTLL
ncbi:MAG: tetratricopeptide repeat protein [Vampirovibrionales bacterium]|nr:tetratricopeptide repeat protein [Vampirovibrionales bacterium]